MSQRQGRRMNDGNMTGLKQDRYRHSEFEAGTEQEEFSRFGGVSRVTPNTLGVGKFNENRGRRGDQLREDNPFENGDLENWNHRSGWDEHFEDRFRQRPKNHGGSLIGHDAGGQHRGKGPKGWKRPDQRINDDVCETLSSSPEVDAQGIDVRVEEGVVYLEGEVHDRDMKKMAEREIENISGVMDVQNLLSFKSRGSGSRRDSSLS